MRKFTADRLRRQSHNADADRDGQRVVSDSGSLSDRNADAAVR
jgi:hypothetical protein